MADLKKQYLGLALAASQLGFLVAAGLLGGLWLDKHWETTPLFGFLGLAAGFGSGIHILIRLVRLGQKQGKDSDDAT